MNAAHEELGWPSWIGLVVEDLQGQRRFYREVLGFRELGAGADWVQFDFGGGRLVELIRRRETPEYDHPRCQVGYTVTDIVAARAELIARGAIPITGLKGGKEDGGRWCYFRDPEGNVFELKEHLLSGSRHAGAAARRS